MFSLAGILIVRTIILKLFRVGTGGGQEKVSLKKIINDEKVSLMEQVGIGMLGPDNALGYLGNNRVRKQCDALSNAVQGNVGSSHPC